MPGDGTFRSRWEARWRVEIDPRGWGSRYALRRVVARGPAALKSMVAARAGAAFAGELLVIPPSGGRLWTDVVRLARWSGAALPESRTDGLWPAEERRMLAERSLMAALHIALSDAVGAGVILSYDMSAILALATHGARQARLPASCRRY